MKKTTNKDNNLMARRIAQYRSRMNVRGVAAINPNELSSQSPMVTLEARRCLLQDPKDTIGYLKAVNRTTEMVVNAIKLRIAKEISSSSEKAGSLPLSSQNVNGERSQE